MEDTGIISRRQLLAGAGGAAGLLLARQASVLGAPLASAGADLAASPFTLGVAASFMVENGVPGAQPA